MAPLQFGLPELLILALIGLFVVVIIGIPAAIIYALVSSIGD